MLSKGRGLINLDAVRLGLPIPREEGVKLVGINFKAV